MIHRTRQVISVGSTEGEEVLDLHNTGLSIRTLLQGVGNVEYAQTVEYGITWYKRFLRSMINMQRLPVSRPKFKQRECH
jgi:hypothetical protein